jgi:hypothetical protein
MKLFAVLALVLAIPSALFAQSHAEREKKALQRLGLSDALAAQVMDIQGKTESTIRQDAVQIRLLRAQMQKALLAAPAAVDMQAVNGLINQMAQARADIQKTFVGAELQLRQIMGDDGFRAYMRHMRREFHHGYMARRPMGGNGFRGGGMPFGWYRGGMMHSMHI